MWFDDDQWIGREVTFDVPQGLSKWKINEKTYERAMISSEWATKERDDLSQARAIFTCVNDQHHVALLKVRMQYVLSLFYHTFLTIKQDPISRLGV